MRVHPQPSHLHAFFVAPVQDHPRVAETCSNLAILYNQQGAADDALPLYERALQIYEKAYGPNHSDVAHTLTDLAVRAYMRVCVRACERTAAFGCLLCGAVSGFDLRWPRRVCGLCGCD